MYMDSAFVEIIMFISHGIWLLRTRKIRRRAKQAGVSFDDFPEAIEWQERAFKFGLREPGNGVASEEVRGSHSPIDLPVYSR